MNLARWIRRRPVPHAIQCDERKIIIGDGHRRWADAVDAVMATASNTIVALDAKGTVLRVCQRADVDDVETPTDPVDATDHQREMAQVAQIIADAYSTAHDHARENSARGYELLARFAELSFGRLAAIERAYAQLLQAHARAMEEQPRTDGLDEALSGMLSGALGSRGNGKSQKEPTP